MQIEKSSDTKLCRKCNIEKPLSEFSKNKNKADGLDYYCKSCRKEYYLQNKEHIRQKTKEYYYSDIDNSREYHRKYKKSKYQISKEYREKLINSLKTPCVKCGESRLCVIQFHHVNSNDKTKPVTSYGSLEGMREEAKKCVCLCANCHMEFHYLYGTKKGDKQKQLEEYLKGEV